MRPKLTILMLVVLGVMASREARAFYNPSTGRWLSRDPIGEKGGMNLQSFVRNRAVNRIDRDGREEECHVTTVPGKHNDQDDPFEDRARDNVEEAKGQTVFEVTSTADANKKLLTCKPCIKELNIIGHANEGFQNVSSKNDPNRATTGRLSANSDGKGGYTYTGMNMFTGVVFCKPCTVVLRGCKAAKGGEGKALLAEIARITGCTSKGYSNNTYNDFRSDGPFPGDGPVYPGPDIRVDPPIPKVGAK